MRTHAVAELDERQTVPFPMNQDRRSPGRMAVLPENDHWMAETQPDANRQPAAIEQPRVSVIIPTLNEAENLPHVLPHIPDWVHEVIIVDGHSTDGTIEVAQRLRPDVRIVLEIGRGKGTALRAGFGVATGDIIVMLDADGSTDPREIPTFVSMLLTGADFAKGTRFAQGGGTADMTPLRRIGNLGFVWLVRLLFGGRYTDLLYGYNAFWTRVLDRLRLASTGFEIETEMNIRALRAGLRIFEVPSFEAERVHGVGRLQTFPDGWRVLKAIARETVDHMQASLGSAGRAADPQPAHYDRSPNHLPDIAP